MPRVAANLGLKETNFEALTDMLQTENVQSEGIYLNPADSKYPQRRVRKYSWWRNQPAALRRQICDAVRRSMTPAEVQDALRKTCALAREMSKNDNYGIDLRHFLFDWESHPVISEHAQLKAALEKKKQLREGKQQGQGEPGEPASKRQRGDGGSLLNSGVARKSSGKRKGTFDDDDDDDHEGPGIGVETFAYSLEGVEPRWFQRHRVMHAVLKVPGFWSPVSDEVAPEAYSNNYFYASMRWRNRDIINMLDKVSPLSELTKEIGIDLCPPLLMIVSDIAVC